MDYTKTMQALKWLMVETGSLACLGCEHEDHCSVHGCAILRNAAEHMEAALANYDHLSALVDQQEANFKLCNKYLIDSAEARSALARQLAAAQKELAEVKAEQAWISVKDRLPDATFCVLVHYDDGNVLVDAIGSDGEWMDEDFSCGKITHWMPLPEPPEKEA